MSRPLPAVLCCLGLLAVLVTGCGETVNVPKSDQAVLHGANLFKQRCSGCHTLDAAAAQGSTPVGKVAAGERTDGPNFNVRKETREDVLYAIRNGGFSGAIMPANVVVGRDAQDVALFVEQYAGTKAGKTSENTSPKSSPGG